MAKRDKLKIGIAIPQLFPKGEVDTSEITSFLAKVESLGYHSVWVQDSIVGGRPHLEALSLLTYAAAFSNRLKLGTSVVLTAFRNPFVLAKSLAAIDQLSKGRLIFGLGYGGMALKFTDGTQNDSYGAFGLSLKGRVTRFEEGIELLKRLWTEDIVTFEGRFWQAHQLCVRLKPVQKPHPPIWFGAHAEAALCRAARLGDGWMGAGYWSTKAFKDEIKLVRRFLEEEGRDPDTFALSKRVFMLIDKNKKRATEKAQEYIGRQYGDPARALEICVFGSEEECVEGLGEVVSQGIDLLVLNPMYDAEEQAERLAKDVIPKL